MYACFQQLQMCFHCYFFWTERRSAYGHDNANENGSKCRESSIGDKHGKACYGDKQTIAVKIIGYDATQIVSYKQH